MTQAQTTTNGTPKRTRKPAGPMTPTKALAAIAKLRDKAKADEVKILEQLAEPDRAKCIAFLSVG